MEDRQLYHLRGQFLFYAALQVARALVVRIWTEFVIGVVVVVVLSFAFALGLLSIAVGLALALALALLGISVVLASSPSASRLLGITFALVFALAFIDILHRKMCALCLDLCSLKVE